MNKNEEGVFAGSMVKLQKQQITEFTCRIKICFAFSIPRSIGEVDHDALRAVFEVALQNLKT